EPQPDIVVLGAGRLDGGGEERHQRLVGAVGVGDHRLAAALDAPLDRPAHERAFTGLPPPPGEDDFRLPGDVGEFAAFQHGGLAVVSLRSHWVFVPIYRVVSGPAIPWKALREPRRGSLPCRPVRSVAFRPSRAAGGRERSWRSRSASARLAVSDPAWIACVLSARSCGSPPQSGGCHAGRAAPHRLTPSPE